MSDEIVQAHIPCPDCGSSDGRTEYTDHYYCFVCEKYTPKTESVTGSKSTRKKRKLPMFQPEDMEYRNLKARGLTQETCRKFSYGITRDDFGNIVQVARYFDDDGIELFQKTRDKEKNFVIRGKKCYRFFGQNLFKGGRKLVITEGEIDCLTVSQVNDNKYPTVSIPFGTRSAKETFKEQYNYLMNFDEVIVMFDMDVHGKEAVNSIAGILPPNKLKIAELPYKDPNECLLKGQPEAIIRAIWDAKTYKPDGIVSALDLKDTLFSADTGIVSYDYPFSPKLNEMTQGIRKGEMILLTAGTGIGKSTTAREVAYKLKMKDNLKIGMVMLEENPKKTLRDLLSIHLSKPLHLLWNNEEVRKEAQEAFDVVFGDNKLFLYDHFGSIESGNLLNKIRYLITAEQCDFIVFDHISIAVSGMDSGGDERRTIDKLMTDLRSLVEETGAGLIIVSHLRKTDTKSNPFEQGGTISLDDLRGSGSLKQLPDIIIALERNQQAQEEHERNLLKVRVLKNRFTGTTGLADKIRFNKSTNRLEDVDELEMASEQEDTNSPF